MKAIDKDNGAWPPVCKDPNHLPGVLFVSIPPGEVYVHKCPSCGHKVEIRGTDLNSLTIDSYFGA